MRSTRTMAAMAVSALLAISCGGPADGSGATVIDDETFATESAEAESAEEPDDTGDETALGTRTNPLAVGTTIELGGWELSVTEVTLDATDDVLAHNQFNDEPADGRQFLMFWVEATYEGDESGNPWLDFSWAIVGGGGNTFSSGSDDYCGSIPNSLGDQGETYPGGSVDGNVCIAVASDQIDGATIRVEETFSFDDTRAFFTVN